MLERILTVVFGVEEINGGERCPTYLYRWTLFQPKRPKWLWRGFGIYLHKFVASDWSRDLHDHPKRFISIGLKGQYVELSESQVTQQKFWMDPDGRVIARGREEAFGLGTRVERTFRAPWVRTFRASHRHRIVGPTTAVPCWTLVIVLARQREWGFYTPTGWVDWRAYVRSSRADAARDC